MFADEPRVPQALIGRVDIVLPHVGSATTRTREVMGRRVVDNVGALLERGELVTPVGGRHGARSRTRAKDNVLVVGVPCMPSE